jgi:hypothetical protein
MATIFLSAMMFSDQLVGLKIVIFSSFQVIDLFKDFNCVFCNEIRSTF